MDERQFRILFWGSEFSLPRDDFDDQSCFKAAEAGTKFSTSL
jgi:hypothetical protein